MARHPAIVLIYAEDGRGLGHVSLISTIAKRLVSDHEHVMVVLVTEAQIGDLFQLPERCDHIKLPTRRPMAEIAGAEQGGSSSGPRVVYRRRLKERFRSLRRRLLADMARELQPSLVLVDHEPLGYAGEFREGLSLLKRECPSAGLVFLMRDIADEPVRTRRQWQDLRAYDALENLYDGVAVYGSREIYDVVSAYGFSSVVQDKLRYCGYVVRGLSSPNRPALRKAYELPEGGPLVVAMVGSGSDGQAVLAAALPALEQLRRRHQSLHAVLVTGPFMETIDQEFLRQQAPEYCRVVERADTLELLAAADAAISMGGYNSVFEALALAVPLVVVPRDPRSSGKMEQLIRAEALSACNLIRYVNPEKLDGAELAQALGDVLDWDRSEYSDRIRRVIPDFHGAKRLTGYLSSWLATDETPKR